LKNKLIEKDFDFVVTKCNIQTLFSIKKKMVMDDGAVHTLYIALNQGNRRGGADQIARILLHLLKCANSRPLQNNVRTAPKRTNHLKLRNSNR